MSVTGHRPPDFFKRGPAPVLQLVFFVAMSLSLMFVDMRYRYLEPLRKTVAVATYPFQMLAYGPVAFVDWLGSYVSTVETLRAENRQLNKLALDAATVALRQEHLDRENQQLRALLDMKTRQPVSGTVAAILYNVRDPFSRKVIIDRGTYHGVEPGRAVVDEIGVVGQVTRSYPLQAEVTLLTNKDQGVPVQIARNGLRSAVFGSGDGQLELRFMASNGDVKVGDLLETSGLDGVFVPGLPVAKVTSVQRDVGISFARILCEPLGGVEKGNLVMVLGKRDLPTPPPVESDAPDKPAKSKKARRKE